MKALIVEPSRMIRNVLVSLFSKNKVTAVAVETAAEALKELERERVDFLCFSMRLSDMTGIEFFFTAKQRNLIGKHPSVLLTSSHDEIATQAAAAGITECFSKEERAVFEDYVNRWAISGTALLSGDVLLLEDSSVQAAQLAKLLGALGLKSTLVSTGKEGIRMLSQQRFDLVLVDYMLEGTLTGLGVIREIRAMEGRTGTLPILAISSFDDIPRRVEMLRSGANDFVLKPVVPEEFQMRVRNLILLRQALDHLEAQHQVLYEMAMQDRLTGVYNRHFVYERIQPLIREAAETKQPLSVISLDIDHFKRINDSFGHAMGDLVLVAIATLLREQTENKGLIARMGGEEFIAVLPDTDDFSATQRAEHLREAIEDLEPEGLHVTASLGVAQLLGEERFESLLSRADAAMYEAKRNGRNQVVSAAG